MHNVRRCDFSGILLIFITCCNHCNQPIHAERWWNGWFWIRLDGWTNMIRNLEKLIDTINERKNRFDNSTWSSIIDNKGSPWSTKDVDVGKCMQRVGGKIKREVNLDLCWFLWFQKLKALSPMIPVAGNFQSWVSSLSSLSDVLCMQRVPNSQPKKWYSAKMKQVYCYMIHTE